MLLVVLMSLCIIRSSYIFVGKIIVKPCRVNLLVQLEIKNSPNCEVCIREDVYFLVKKCVQTKRTRVGLFAQVVFGTWFPSIFRNFVYVFGMII